MESPGGDGARAVLEPLLGQEQMVADPRISAAQLGQFQQGRPVALVPPVYVGRPQLERFRDLIAPAGPEPMAGA